MTVDSTNDGSTSNGAPGPFDWDDDSPTLPEIPLAIIRAAGGRTKRLKEADESKSRDEAPKTMTFQSELVAFCEEHGRVEPLGVCRLCWRNTQLAKELSLGDEQDPAERFLKSELLWMVDQDDFNDLFEDSDGGQSVKSRTGQVDIGLLSGQLKDRWKPVAVVLFFLFCVAFFASGVLEPGAWG